MESGRAESYGQALQHLDCCLDVVAGDKVTLVVKRDGPEVCSVSSCHLQTRFLGINEWLG